MMPGEAIASTVLQQPLGSVIDARLHNLDQDVLLFDPSPERDSAVEIAAELLRPGADVTALAAELLSIIRKIADSNAREGGCEREAAGQLDKLARSLHQNGRRSPLTVKQASRRLRTALKILGPSPDGVAYFRASCEIKDVVMALPFETLFGPGLRHELGDERTVQLAKLLDEPDAVAA